MTLTNETLVERSLAKDLVLVDGRDDNDGRIDVSVVVPLMNEEATLVTLFERIRAVCTGEQLVFEVIFVDDGSTDRSVEVLEALSARDRPRPHHPPTPQLREGRRPRRRLPGDARGRGRHHGR